MKKDLRFLRNVENSLFTAFRGRHKKKFRVQHHNKYTYPTLKKSYAFSNGRTQTQCTKPA